MPPCWIRNGDIEPGECDGLLQDGRARGAGDNAHLGAADMYAIAVSNGFVTIHFESDELSLRVLAPPQQCLAADEILVLALEWHGETDAGFERIGLIAKFVTGEDETRLDTHHVQRLQAERHQSMRLASLPDGIEYRKRILRMAEDFVAELAGIARA
jgi:hypothetical protein